MVVPVPWPVRTGTMCLLELLLRRGAGRHHPLMMGPAEEVGQTLLTAAAAGDLGATELLVRKMMMAHESRCG